MKLIKVLMISLFCLVLCFGCGKKEEDGHKAVKSQSDEAEKEIQNEQDSQIETDTRTGNEIIVEAMEKTLKMPSFKADTEGSLKLGGKTINGEFGMDSRIHVVQGEDGQNLQMTVETELNPGNAVSKAYYKDGWYYMGDGKNQQKLKKSPEEVLSVITDITDMVTETSDKIENLRIKEDGTNKIYTYELPSFIAEDYIVRLMAQMGTEDTIFENTSVQIDSLEFVSEVDKEGVLARQEIKVLGTLEKSIVSVPAEARITAEFTQTDEKDLQME